MVNVAGVVALLAASFTFLPSLHSTEADKSSTISLKETFIAFTSNRDGNYEIHAMNIDGTNQIRLTNAA